MANDFTIALKNCTFHGFHGVLEEEKQQGQPFIVDAILHVANTQGILTDEVDETLDYSIVFQRIEAIVTLKRYNLIERLAKEIANQLCDEFSELSRVEITIKKPQAPIKGMFDHVAVTVVHEQ